MEKYRPNQISFLLQLFEFGTGEGASDDWRAMYRNLIATKALRKHKNEYSLEVGAGHGGFGEFLDSEKLDVVCLEPHMNRACQIAIHGILSVCGSLNQPKLPPNSVVAMGLLTF